MRDFSLVIVNNFISGVQIIFNRILSASFGSCQTEIKLKELISSSAFEQI